MAPLQPFSSEADAWLKVRIERDDGDRVFVRVELALHRVDPRFAGGAVSLPVPRDRLRLEAA